MVMGQPAERRSQHRWAAEWKVCCSGSLRQPSVLGAVLQGCGTLLLWMASLHARGCSAGQHMCRELLFKSLR